METTLISALKQNNTSHIPVWFMRQAGRYLPEYMKLKDQHDFRSRTHTPDLMTEITLQPLRRYPLDAAIMFSDILTPLEFMGAEFDFSGGGPKLENSGIDTLKKINALNTDDMSFVYQGIKKIKSQLDKTPLIGFVGAPFTLASYIIEGGTSKDFIKTKQFMYSRPEDFKKSINLLADSIASYLEKQIEAGADAVQIFDSWVGFLSSDSYEEYILPNMQKLISRIQKKGRPVILYSQPCSHLLPLLAKTKADAISIDWRIAVDEAWHILDKAGFKGSIQGNLDPIVTNLDWSEAKPYVDKLLQRVKSCEITNRYVFNVGHGVNPQTKYQTLEKIVHYVHSK